jgi:membrane-bound lytic murein transglycosylase D
MNFFYCIIIIFTGFQLRLSAQINTSISETSAQACRLDSSISENLDSTDYYTMITNELDSLLSLWYNGSASNMVSFLEPVAASNDDNVNLDSLYAARLARIPSLIPMTYNADVRRYIELYAVRKRNFSGRILGLTKIYFPLFEEVLDKYNMPMELKNLAIIESALNPNAVSRVGATGLWQFMFPTGKMYGLEVNTFIDERRDPVKSTHAAAQYLRDLHKIYDDWALALAAYNCGPGNVNKAIRRSGGKKDFWEIYDFLPKETRGYVPGFIAATYTMHYYNEHGIVPIEPDFPLATDTVMIHKELHLQQVATVLQIPIEILQKLNPQYRRDIIPAVNAAFPLVLPIQHTLAFDELRDSIQNYNYDTYLASFRVVNYTPPTRNLATNTVGNKKYHTVKKGESLTMLANRYGISVAEIKYMNRIKSNSIHPGQRLHIGFDGSAEIQVAEAPTVKTNVDSNLKPNTPVVLDPSNSNTQTTVASEGNISRTIGQNNTYRVNQGDTLWSIAQKYPGITYHQIIEYNNLGEDPKIRPGQVLKIPQTSSSTN